ncbi:hypothetical protein AB0M46_41155 [Dactylosporangium sp. NPDC051485]|uniref:hypothetical protein n=1 Tax=Dactylosporangium sp. NPDC051485 TaxID=3154846 RepID=UPI00344707D3
MIAARLDENAPPADDPFTALIAELTELGYTAGDAVDGISTYADPEGGGVLATIDVDRRHEVRLSRRNDDGDPTWMIRLTADVPEHVQRVVLYAMLHADHTDEQQLLRNISGAIAMGTDEA